MQAGKLDRRLIIKTPVFTRDAHGGRVTTYTTLATVDGGMLPVAGSRLFEAAQFIDGAQVRFQIRWRSDFDKSARIRFEGQDYQVLRIDEIGRRRGLHVWAKLP
jgi:SPP1 family predicted phage head-tail adaptor